MKNTILRIRQTIKSFPKWIWAGLIIALITGWLIGHTGSQPEPKTGNNESTARSDTTKVQWWTCAMHPQIKLPSPGKCPICFMDLIPLKSETTEDAGPRELKMSPSAIELADIATAAVHRGKAVREVRLSGKIVPDERRVRTITAWVPGRLEKLVVDFTGTEVRQGDPLVELYSPALYTAQEELLQALRQRSGISSDIVVEAAREKLRQLGLTDVQIRQVENRGTATDRVNIVSPVSGVVIHKNALEGRYVDRGTQIYKVADLSRVWAILDAYEQDIDFLREGQAVRIEAGALPGRTLRAKIAFIDPVLDSRTRTIQIRLDLPNPDGALKPGMFIEGTVEAVLPFKDREPLLVPATAVLKTGKRAVVYVKKPDILEPVFEGREVILGPRAGDNYVVISGLAEGEEVVVKGNFKIDSALQIEAKPSMMNPEGGMAMTGHANHGAEMSAQPGENSSTGSAASLTIQHTSKEFIESLKPVFNAYLNARHALTQDDFKSSRESLIRLHTALRSRNSGLPSPPKWTGIRDSLLTITEHANHWADIEAARNAFRQISELMIRMEKIFGHSGSGPLYQVHCPMAFDNEGADWLQPDSTIANPYLGLKMPRCGDIMEKFETR